MRSGVTVQKRLLFTGILAAFIVVAGILWTHSLANYLFRATRWIFIVTFAAGLTAGVIGSLLKQSRRSKPTTHAATRHSLVAFMEHWGTAAGIVIMIVSGYQIHNRGGLPAIRLHFLGLFLTLLFGGYFTADFFISKKYRELFPNIKDIIDGTIKKYLLRIKSKETGKYLSSQKASFLLFGIIGGVILITGIIKLIPFYGSIPFSLLKSATTIHDIAAWALAVLLAVHILLAIVWGAYRPLLLSWFNGRDPSGDLSAVSKPAIPKLKTKIQENNKPIQQK